MNHDPCSYNSPSLLSLAAALQKLQTAISPVTGHEKLFIKQALGRVLSHELHSPLNLPGARNAAMDGYAYISDDLQANTLCTLRVVGTSWAGKPFNAPLNSGECVRIFTGAVVPENADSVIMQENVQTTDSLVHIPATTHAKQNIREIGDDVRANELLFPAGKTLTAADIGLLAAVGIAEVSVIRRLNLGFFSNGDELVGIGQTLCEGQLYDSNRYTLNALLQQQSINATDLGVIGDDPTQLENCLRLNAKHFDAIISTGGASVGDADHIKDVLMRCGQINFWKIAIKPGKPLAFGRIGDCYFFGLPGNPAAVLTTFQQVVSPALHYLMGTPPAQRWQIKAICMNDLKKAPGRLEFQRGCLKQATEGHFEVSSSGAQGSHRLSSYSLANCYIVLSEDCQGVRAGEVVVVEPFN